VPRSSSLLVTGGAGYVGSHVVVAALDAGRDVLVADDFTNASHDAIERIAAAAGGRRPRVVEVDVTDRERLERALAGESIAAAIHLAGGGDVVGAINVREVVGTVPFVFSSSASVYGVPWRCPIEEHDACAPASVEGVATVATERALQAASARGSPLAILRYFHAAGAHRSGRLGPEPDVGSTLMSRLQRAAIGEMPSITLMGCDYPTRDGTALRDYVHVVDVAEAHLRALEALELRGSSFVLNLGSPRGSTVREVVSAFEARPGAASRSCPARGARAIRRSCGPAPRARATCSAGKRGARLYRCAKTCCAGRAAWPRIRSRKRRQAGVVDAAFRL
jgi:UDP-glucose 4-epimerase